jgi:hypothetical protein
MNVDIKIKNLPETVTVNNILSIKDFYSFNSTTKEYTSFSNLQFLSKHYYSFIGDEILHVNGDDINFVYFYNN